MPAIPNTTQLAIVRRLEKGLPPRAEQAAPVAPLKVITTEWGREPGTRNVLFHRFVEGRLAPELFRIWEDGRVSQH